MPPKTRSLQLASITPEAAAYTAGFIDGEGTISITIGKTGHNWTFIFVSIVQSEPGVEALQFIQAVFGGSLTPKKPDNGRGSIRSNYTKWVLGIRAQSYVIRLLEAVLPFLIVKRRKAEQALEILTSRNRGNTWWTPEEDERLLREYGRGNVAELAAAFDRTIQSVWAHHKYLKHHGR